MLRSIFSQPNDNAMAETIIENKEFSKVDFTDKGFEKGEYDACTFVDCNFAECTLAGSIFVECEFRNCNLTMANVNDTSLKDVQFHSCKLLGVKFSECSTFLLEFEFDNCQLNLCSFYQLKLRGQRFRNCSMHEVDFVESDLAESIFHDCDLSGAVFDNTVLEKADFRTATHYSIDPETNHIAKAKFSLEGLPGLLQRYDLKIDG